MSPERRADFLTNLPVPDLYPRQLDLFTPKALLAKKSGRFDISEGIGAFNNPNPTKVLVFDIGGTAVKMGEVTVRQGMVVIEENMVATVQSENEGTNYLPAMLRMRDQYPELPVGVSTAGVVDENGDLEISPNLHVFTDNLKEMGGFKNIFGSVSVLNDASAGLTIGGVKVPQQLLRSNLVHVIFSGGIGGAALNKDGDIISMEPGHIPVIEELNPYQIDKPCGLYSGWDHVCLERVGAVGAFVEKQWERLTGNKRSGKDIAELMYSGDSRALSLFDCSSRVLAHVIAGMTMTLGFNLKDTTVIVSGGGIKTEGMTDRIKKILAKHDNTSVDKIALVSTPSMGIDNTCFLGAAIAGATLSNTN